MPCVKRDRSTMTPEEAIIADFLSENARKFYAKNSDKLKLKRLQKKLQSLEDGSFVAGEIQKVKEAMAKLSSN